MNIYLWSLVASANGYLMKGESVSVFKGIKKMKDGLSKGKVWKYVLHKFEQFANTNFQVMRLGMCQFIMQKVYVTRQYHNNL